MQGGEGMTTSGQWWIENVLEECDDAREYYYDTRTHQLYYNPNATSGGPSVNVKTPDPGRPHSRLTEVCAAGTVECRWTKWRRGVGCDTATVCAARLLTFMCRAASNPRLFVVARC